MQFEIRELTGEQAVEYKKFLSKGLVEDEDKFRISPDDEKNSVFPTLGTGDSFTLLALLDQQWAGVVSFERDGKTREKLRHKGTLFRMYVNPQFRGKGVGRQLIKALMERVAALKDIEQINLTVVATNTSAKKLYESLGFKTFSVEENAIKWKGRYFTEEQMVVRV